MTEVAREQAWEVYCKARAVYHKAWKVYQQAYAEQAAEEAESPPLGPHDEQRTSDVCERGICLRPDHTL